MSTERKPGSRGVRDTFARDKVNLAQRPASELEDRQNPNPKGSTKTVSPARSFKRKPRKK